MVFLLVFQSKLSQQLVLFMTFSLVELVLPKLEYLIIFVYSSDREV